MVASRYYLPCTCGKSQVVDAGLAGATITCDCGQTLEVPTLRGLRSLEALPEESAPVVVAGKAQAVGCLFAMCLIAAFLAGTVAAGAWLIGSKIDTSYTMEHEIAKGNKVIDGLTVGQAHELWKMFEDNGLGTPETPRFIINLQWARTLRQITTVGLLISTLALAASVIVGGFDVISKNKRGKK